VHLYRIITEVRAGSEQQPAGEPGQAGLATVWVRSQSEEEALRHAREVIDSRRYQSVGELTIFQEESSGLLGAGEEEPQNAGYTSLREKALARGDGLFEIWFPAK
jgi:hypothetical protein